MKVKITAIEVSYKGELLEVHPVRDCYQNYCMVYNTGFFTLEELRQALGGASEVTRRRLLGEMADGAMTIVIEAEVSDLPCIGNLRLTSVERLVDWPETPL